MRWTRVLSFVSPKNPKITASPESKKHALNDKIVPAAQSGHYKIQNILSVECNENAKENAQQKQ